MDFRTIQTDNKTGDELKQVPMILEYTNMLQDALKFFASDQETDEKGLLPFKAVMDSYTIQQFI